MTHASVPPAMRQELGISDTLIRLSVGVEHADDLIADLQRGFRPQRGSAALMRNRRDQQRQPPRLTRTNRRRENRLQRVMTSSELQPRSGSLHLRA